MPGWFDPDEACALRFGGADSASVDVHTGWFPPRATCDFGNGNVQDFISPTKSAVLSATGVLILVVLVAGLILTVRRLTGEPGPLRTADDVDLGKRRMSQLTFGALDMAVAVAVLTAANAFAIILGDLPGGIVFAVAAMVGLSRVVRRTGSAHGPTPEYGARQPPARNHGRTDRLRRDLRGHRGHRADAVLPALVGTTRRDHVRRRRRRPVVPPTPLETGPPGVASLSRLTARPGGCSGSGGRRSRGRTRT